MKPPIVVALTSPSAQSSSSTTAIVHNIPRLPPSLDLRRVDQLAQRGDRPPELGRAPAPIAGGRVAKLGQNALGRVPPRPKPGGGPRVRRAHPRRAAGRLRAQLV